MRSILFKHALVQDAAYGTLLRDPRRSLHARIAEALETQFDEVAEIQPELLARHSTEAGLIEKAALQWGKAGYRSLARSALVEAVAQITRALDQIATLPSTPDLRRQRIRASGRTDNPAGPCQGLCGVGDEGSSGAGPLIDQAIRSARRTSRGPIVAVLRSVWLLGIVLRCIQR